MTAKTQTNVVNSWDIINPDLIIAEDRAEITKLYNLMYRWLLWKFAADEEIISQTFMRVLKKIKTHYKPEKGLFSNFVYTVCINLSVNYFKKILKEKQKEINLIENISPRRKEIFLTKNVTQIAEEFLPYNTSYIPAEEPEEDLTAFFYQLISFLPDSDKEFVFNFLNGKIKKNGSNRIRFCRLKKIITEKIKLWDSLEK